MARYANPKPADQVKVKSVVQIPEPVILNSELTVKATKSLKALKAHLDSEASVHHETVYLIIDTVVPTSSKNDHIPRIIPLYSKLDKPENRKIMLVTKDPVMTYKEPITKRESPTEDLFNEIICFKKLRSMSKNSKTMTKLYHDNDLVLVDHRVHRLLPDILRKTIFYKNNKKIPLMVQMAKPDAEAQLVKSKKSNKLKDERVEPAYILKQVKSIVKNTTFVPTTGKCLSIVIGYSDFKVENLVLNIDAVLHYLIDAKFKPIGGLIKKGLEGIDDLHVKTSESVSLPIMEKKRN